MAHGFDTTFLSLLAGERPKVINVGEFPCNFNESKTLIVHFKIIIIIIVISERGYLREKSNKYKSLISKLV